MNFSSARLLIKPVIKSLVGVLFLSLMLTFQNCSKARFTTDATLGALNGVAGNGNGGGNDQSCHPHSVTGNKIVKVLFVIDTSGSNQGTDGTDPNKKWRSATMSNFINQYKEKSNFYYGLITFQGSTAKEQIKVNGTAVFSNDLTVVQSGYESFMNTADGGSTPYKAALKMAQNMISADLAANADQKASYVMVMVSDGQAKDYTDASQVIPDAKAIENLAPNQISLNSVYYFSKVFAESETKYLRNISSVGGGAFIIANSNQVLSVEDVIQLPATGCQ